MARRYWRRYRKRDEGDPLFALFALVVLSVGFYIYKHMAQVTGWIIFAACIAGAGFLAYRFLKKRKRSAAMNWDDDKILYMLKGMSPAQFEKEIAEMFRGLGYEAQVTGGANDAGIDVVAHKDGKKFYIQCKKFITREVTPHDVRDFLGAITNVNNPAEKGFFSEQRK